jgi:hypothetical protein
MRKRIIVSLIAAVALAIGALPAGAAIGITQAPAGPGYQNLSPWTSTGVCGGQGGTYSASGAPIRLGFGWFTSTQGGLKQFFQNSSGYVEIRGTDSLDDSWAESKSGSAFVTQQGIAWTTGEPNTGITPGGVSVKGQASWYRGVLSLAPGTYTLRVAFVLSKQINDGWDDYSGTIGNGSGCTFTVVA